MWTYEERQLFDQASQHIVNAQYAEGLEVASVLLDLVMHDPAKWAYAAGCLQAIALRHLGRREQARTIFAQAYRRALVGDAPVIAAYIKVDWSSEEPDPYAALEMVKEAMEACKAADSTPDPKRHLAADLAFFGAVFARHAARAGMEGIAPFLFLDAQSALKKYAYGDYPRYRGAYLVALMYEQQLVGLKPTWRTFESWLRIHCLIALEIVRQGRLRAAILLLISPARRQQINVQ